MLSLLSSLSTSKFILLMPILVADLYTCSTAMTVGAPNWREHAELILIGSTFTGHKAREIAIRAP